MPDSHQPTAKPVACSVASHYNPDMPVAVHRLGLHCLGRVLDVTGNIQGGETGKIVEQVDIVSPTVSPGNLSFCQIGSKINVCAITNSVGPEMMSSVIDTKVPSNDS